MCTCITDRVTAQPQCTVMRQPFCFTHLQSPRTPEQPCLPSRGMQSLCSSLWPSPPVSCNKIPPWEDNVHAAHRWCTCQNFEFYCGEQLAARGGQSLTSNSDHPSQGPLQKPAISLKREYNKFMKLCATGQMGCVSLTQLNSSTQNHLPFSSGWLIIAVTPVSLCHICQITVKNITYMISQHKIWFAIMKMLRIPIKRQVDSRTEQTSQTQGSYYSEILIRNYFFSNFLVSVC